MRPTSRRMSRLGARGSSRSCSPRAWARRRRWRPTSACTRRRCAAGSPGRACRRPSGTPRPRGSCSSRTLPSVRRVLGALACRLGASSAQSLGRAIRAATGLRASAFRDAFDGETMLRRFREALVTPYRDRLRAFDPGRRLHAARGRRRARSVLHSARRGRGEGGMTSPSTPDTGAPNADASAQARPMTSAPIVRSAAAACGTTG